jgi:type IV secretion system protein VirD4
MSHNGLSRLRNLSGQITEDLTFRRELVQFSLEEKAFLTHNTSDFPYAMDGGVPLSWSENAKTLYLDSSDKHTLIVGSTGSQKSRLFVMPTVKVLGYAGESMIITDPKGEIYKRTSGELKDLGYEIRVLNFRSPQESATWNPLAEPYRHFMSGDVAKACELIADIADIIGKTGASSKDPYWDIAAADFCYGLIMFMFVYCKNNNIDSSAINMKNLIQLRRKMFIARQPVMSFWEYAEDDTEFGPMICAALTGTFNNSENTRSNILSMFDSKVRPFAARQDLLDMMASNNLSLESVGKTKTAIFLIIPDEKTSCHNLVSMFVKQSYEYFIEQTLFLENNVMPVRINYILDEFSSLPKINDFPAMITAARSRNIRFCLIVQSKHQLSRNYEDDAETIRSNCLNWIFITSRELDFLSEVSDLCGKKSDGTPVLSIAELQCLDRKKGEILVLSDRLGPYLTYMPSIDVYDNKVYQAVPFELLSDEKLEPLDFILPPRKRINPFAPRNN